jgi:hypothetical protein
MGDILFLEDFDISRHDLSKTLFIGKRESLQLLFDKYENISIAKLDGYHYSEYDDVWRRVFGRDIEFDGKILTTQSNDCIGSFIRSGDGTHLLMRVGRYAGESNYLKPMITVSDKQKMDRLWSYANYDFR